MNTTPTSENDRPVHPPGFRPRRGLNWGSLGLMYASYYLCRYNFDWASPDLQKQFNFNYSQITQILGAFFWAYGFGQLINGLFTDRIGGKKAMLIGAFATIFFNILFGWAAIDPSVSRFTETILRVLHPFIKAVTFGTVTFDPQAVAAFTTFAGIWMLNGYFQAFGAPGMVKINASWFHRTERGTFAGIFGFMIQLGRVGINELGPLLLKGGPLLLIFVLPALHWHWLFWVPPLFTAVMVVLVLLFVKETPQAAGFKGMHEDDPAHAGDDVKVNLKEALLTIGKHPLVWYYAAAYACTGAVRNADRLAILFFVDHLGLTRQMPEVKWTSQLMPLVAVLGSFAAGWISDRVFRGHRAPVAMSLYLLESVVLIAGIVLIEGFGIKSVFVSCLFLVLISLTANSTHSIVGAAAPMDIGGPKMAGFACGVIDSFQYFGAGIAVPLMGKLLDKYGWSSWFPTMAGFGLLGALAMYGVIRKQRHLAKQAKPISG